MSRSEIAALACRMLALAMFAVAAAAAIPFLTELVQIPPSMWVSILETGLAVFGVGAFWTLFAVYYWQRADRLALRMVDNDPEPVMSINFTADDVLVAGCRIIGVVLLVTALRIGVDLAAIAFGPGERAVGFHLPTAVLKAVFEAMIGFGLLFGTHGIVGFLRSTRHAGPELSTAPGDGPAARSPARNDRPPSSEADRAAAAGAATGERDGAAMLSIEFAALAIRLGTLVLYAVMGIWAAGAVLWALVFAYKLLVGGHASQSLVMFLQFLVPCIVAGLLAKHLWRHAEDLSTPPDFEPEEWTEAPQGGREFLTAALVWVGAYYLVTGARGLVEAWFVYDLYRGSSIDFGGYSYDAFAAANALLRFVGAGVDIVTAMVLVFAGRWISQRLYGASAA